MQANDYIGILLGVDLVLFLAMLWYRHQARLWREKYMAVITSEQYRDY